MATGTDYEQIYGQAKKAYLQGNFAEATTIIDEMAQEFPNDPTVLLLRGHIYCYGSHQYELARQQYNTVLELSDESDLVSFAQKGLEQIKEWESSSEAEDDDEGGVDSHSEADYQVAQANESELNSFEPSFFANPFANEDQITADGAHQQVGEPISSPFGSQLEDDEQPLDAYSEPEESQEDYSDRFEVESEDPTFVVASEFGSPLRNEEAEMDSVLGVEPEGEDSSENFAVFQSDLEDISSFHMADIGEELPDSSLFVGTPSSQLNEDAAEQPRSSEERLLGAPDADDAHVSPSSEMLIKPTVDVEQGSFAFFKNASFTKKQWMTAGATGITSAIAVLLVGVATSLAAPNESQRPLRHHALMSLAAGVASFGTAFLVGQVATRQVKRTTQELQTQFEAVYLGNNAKATVYSEDELGQLAAGFNRMARVVLTTTREAQRRAEETEQARENLQRQVIRLLDDVEGAARGDLTVQAEVTADVLGAVADAFNLTIQNLREIIEQVKQAAQQVNKGSTDSELFARNQSSDALRMAEELAVTLNSVQMMTDSIQRVAENAREAEEVANSSSATALKGGEAVERTVVGILQIRETVSETARKVKRLAEASQEISKIVALISQIASRTNLLAMNASIQAARAGEAGRGFAIVADEVRQLADRAAKALKEIEQIVLQIQSETGSVMTAMEEGIQQVIDVTGRAEQAKTSLEDIIQVSNRIDTLVRSITADTVEQRENSRAVAQVMQSVELTAQETSQESQRVAGSLQSLVGISQDLLESVERFRISVDEN